MRAADCIIILFTFIMKLATHRFQSDSGQLTTQKTLSSSNVLAKSQPDHSRVVLAENDASWNHSQKRTKYEGQI